jgi:hypothetical protein
LVKILVSSSQNMVNILEIADIEHSILLLLLILLKINPSLIQIIINTSPCSMDGNQGKLSALIMGPRPRESRDSNS